MSTSDKLKILLVDDELDIVTVMKAGLEQYGFSIDGFTNPQQALDHFKPGYYDRIITDIRMPVMSGFDFARTVIAKDPSAQICFMTSFEIHDDEARKVFSNLPSYCFIKKPITANALAKHIKAHIVY